MGRVVPEGRRREADASEIPVPISLRGRDVGPSMGEVLWDRPGQAFNLRHVVGPGPPGSQRGEHAEARAQRDGPQCQKTREEASWGTPTA